MKWPEYEGRTCPYCGRVMGYHSPDGAKAWPSEDHMIPTSLGGPDTDENKIIVCHGCNITKKNLTREDFEEYRRLLGDRYRHFEEGLWDGNLASRLERHRWSEIKELAAKLIGLLSAAHLEDP